MSGNPTLNQIPRAGQPVDFGHALDLLTATGKYTEEDAIFEVHQAIENGQLHLTEGFLLLRSAV